MLKHCAYYICICLLLSCQQQKAPENELSMITLVTRNAVSETINNKDHLKRYKNVNFLTSQPYERVLQVYKNDSLGKSLSKLYSYHPNGSIHQYLEAVNGRAHGKYCVWYDTGIQMLESATIQGIANLTPEAENSWLFDGVCTVWDSEGHLKAQFPYVNGALEGAVVHYFPDGKIKEKRFYIHHQLNGSAKAYYPNGVLQEESEFIFGKRQGITQIFSPNENLLSEENYQENLLMEGIYTDKKGDSLASVLKGHGHQIVFKEGEVAMKQEIHEGIPCGLVEVFGNNTSFVSHSYTIKEGKKDGEERVYYPEGTQAKLSLFWFQDEIRGSVKTWYSSGLLESHREMSHNQKNGISTSWYMDGHLRFIEEYENGLLIKGDYFSKGSTTPISHVIAGKGTATVYDEKGSLLKRVHYLHSQPQT